MPFIPSAAQINQIATSDRFRMWKPTSVICETTPRGLQGQNNLPSLSTGRLFLIGGVVLPANQVVTSITFVSRITALATGSNQWFCLVRLSDLAILGKTADDTSTAWAAYTAKTLNLSSTYTPTVDEAVYLGCVVVASTVPTLEGIYGTTAATGISPKYSATADTGLTDPASLTSVGALTQSDHLTYAFVS